MRIILLTVAVCALAVVPLRAQSDTCPAIVAMALEATDDACAGIGRNEVCYGNLMVEAETDDEGMVFEAAGDVIPASTVRTLNVSRMDSDIGTWGVALLRLQANLPDTLPGQNVTMLVFGDVTLENTVPNDESMLSPMQAFYFNAGIGDSQCAEAPDSGFLMQTPEGAGLVQFTVNGVEVSVGSTVYFRVEAADATTSLAVDVYEGNAVLRVDDETVFVPAGASSRVPLTDDGRAPAGPPEVPIPLEPVAPVEAWADAGQGEVIEAVDVAEPLTEDELVAIPGGAATIYVPAAQPWTDTGLIVEAGQVVTITAAGGANQCATANLNCDGDPNIDRVVGPAGNDAFEQCAGQYGPCLITGPYGLLVAQVGDGAVMAVGTGLTFTADSSGMLRLGYNDHRYDDNGGGFTAVVTTAPGS